MSETLLLERQDKVLHVTLNRPETGNAFNGELVLALRELFATVGTDAGVHVIVLRGAGKSFCSGADIQWMKSMAHFGKAENAADAIKTAGFFEAIDACPKPIVGRVHGAARGGGVGLVACCDIAVGVEAASFALTEVRLGLAPAVISPFVIRKIGVSAARELFLTGERFDAARAREMGLLRYVLPDEAALDAKVGELVKQLLLGGPTALAACKDLARTISGMPGPEATLKTANMLAELRAGAEAQEGMRAFIMKDAPKWTK